MKTTEEPYYAYSDVLPSRGQCGDMGYVLRTGRLDKTSGEFWHGVDFWCLLFYIPQFGDDRQVGPALINCELMDDEDHASLDGADYDRFMPHEDVVEITKKFLEEHGEFVWTSQDPPLNK